MLNANGPIAYSRAVLSLLVLGFAVSGTPVSFWSLGPHEGLWVREAVTPATRDPCIRTISACQTPTMHQYAVDDQISDRPATLIHHAVESVDRSERLPETQFESSLQQDLSLRNGRLPPVTAWARSEGMGFPSTWSEKVPAWAHQSRVERKEGVKN